RLARIRPTRDAIRALGERYVATIVDGARELVAALRASGKSVYVVSGGVEAAGEMLARACGLERSRVRAGAGRHGERGAYVDFDRSSPLATQSGKRVVLAELARSHDGSLAFVGDGATDLAAAPVVRRFIAFGGVARRESVLGAARVRCEARDLRGL